MISAIVFLNKLWENRIIVAIGLFVFLIFSFVVYYKITQGQIKSLKTENTRLVLVVEQQKQAIEQIQRDYKEVIRSREELSTEIQATQTEIQELREKLFRENLGKKPLEELATKKTTLIEKKINKATKEVFRCLEILSEGGDC